MRECICAAAISHCCVPQFCNVTHISHTLSHVACKLSWRCGILVRDTQRATIEREREKQRKRGRERKREKVCGGKISCWCPRVFFMFFVLLLALGLGGVGGYGGWER